MLSVTGMISGLFPAFVEVRLTVPLQVPAGSPATLTETITLSGVVPLDAIADKKPLQFDVLAVTQKLRGPSALPMLMNCAWGCAWPGWKLKFNDAGLALSKGGLVTFKVTGY